MLAPFRVRSFRFQWPADLLTSWGIEMENLVLGWYILVKTGSGIAPCCARCAAYTLVAAAVTALAGRSHFIGRPIMAARRTGELALRDPRPSGIVRNH
jgi:hypothetical protein